MSETAEGAGDSTLPARLATLKDKFRPSSPVDKQDLFKGRLNQLSRVFSAVQELGQHAVIYGERGVGKTSIAGSSRLRVRPSSLIGVTPRFGRRRAGRYGAGSCPGCGSRSRPASAA